MTTTHRIAALAAFSSALLLGTPSLAQTASTPSAQIDTAAWGLYTRLAGTTRRDATGFSMTWHWQEPGRVLIEEYRRPGATNASQTGTITPGPTPGTLVLNASTVVGKKVWNGTVQPDGSVVFLGTGMLKMNYKAVLAADGAYEIRMIKVQNGEVVSVRDPMPGMRYELSPSDAGAAAAVAQEAPPPPAATGTPTVAAAPPPLVSAPVVDPAPQTATAPAVATASPPAPAAKSESPTTAGRAPAASSKVHDATAERRPAARDYLERLVKGPTGKPGVWVDPDSGSVIRFTKSATGYTRVLTRLNDDGSYRPPSVASFEIDGADGSAVMTVGDVRVRLNIGRSGPNAFHGTYVKEPRDSGDVEHAFDEQFSGDARSYTDDDGGSERKVWRADADALAVQAAVAKLRAAQAEAKQIQKKLAAMQAEAHQREVEADIRRREAEEAEQQAQVARLEGEREAAHAQWEEESRRSSQELEDSLQRLRDSTAEYEAVAKRLSGAQSPAASGGRPTDSHAAGSGQTSEQVAASAGAGGELPSTPRTEAAANGESARPGQPLKFKLQVSLEPKPGDTVNPSCYSTLITRGSPGPGWGSSAFNSSDQSNYAKAQAEVDRVKRQFFTACAGSGRTVREGDFRWEWNQISSAQLDSMGARSREDVTVNVP